MNASWAASLLVNTAAKAFLGAFELALICWRGGSASARHVVRLLAMLAVAVLPFFAVWVPAARMPVWAVGAERRSGNEIALTLSLPRFAAEPAQPGKAREESMPEPTPRHAVTLRQGWTIAWLTAWLMGVLAALAPLLLGWSGRKRLRRASRRLDGGDWVPLLNRAQRTAGITRKIELRQSSEPVIPVTWGTLRPVILLPRGAEGWAENRKLLTLTHELAHVRRWDCLAQTWVHAVCALHWFNPLAWRFAKAMRLEREQACDDLLLEREIKASDYAEHLLEIASSLRATRRATAIPMARPSQLEKRIRAMVEARSRRVPGRCFLAFVMLAAIGLLTVLAAQKTESVPLRGAQLRQQQMKQLQAFATLKERQAEALTIASNEVFFPEFRTFFAAARAGEWRTVTNLYADYRSRSIQYAGATGDLPHTAYWQTVLEVCLAFTDVTWGAPEHVQLAVNGFFKSIPEGAVYFGGTDPGRGLPTAFSANQVEARPFFTLTQNALVDSSYLAYLRAMYGSKLQLPGDDDAQKAFAEYMSGATARFRAGKLRPGENVRIDEETHTASGPAVIIAVNALIAKQIFDRNPNRAFFIEESFPLDWMYPHLVPAGQIMKLNHTPLTV